MLSTFAIPNPRPTTPPIAAMVASEAIIGVLSVKVKKTNTYMRIK